MAAGGEPKRTTFAGAWFHCGLAVLAVFVGGLDLSGYALRGWWLLAFSIVLIAAAVELVRLPRQLKRHGRRGMAPLIVLIAALPLANSFGNLLIVRRFRASEEGYIAVASEVMNGTYPDKMRAEHSHLAAWVHPLREGAKDGEVIGAEFAVISYGFAGHVGYMYLADAAIEDRLRQKRPPGWSSWGSSLGDGWYVVRN